MIRDRARMTFGLAVICFAAVFAVALTSTLRPSVVSGMSDGIVALANVTTLADRVPLELSVKDLAWLAQEADRQRRSSGHSSIGSHHPGSLPIMLVKDAGAIRAFIGIDPRNGCRLVVEGPKLLPKASGAVAFHDPCHGSLYDFSGRKIGGPSPWNLDELVITVRNGKVYANPGEVMPGRWIAGN